MVIEYQLPEILVRESITPNQIPHRYRKFRLPFPDTRTRIVSGEWGAMIIQTAIVGGQRYSEVYIDSKVDTEFTVIFHQQTFTLHAVSTGTTYINGSEGQMYLADKRQFLHCFPKGAVFSGSVTAGQTYQSAYITIPYFLLESLSATYTKLNELIAYYETGSGRAVLPFARFGVASRTEVKRMKSCSLKGQAKETYLQNRISDYLIIYLELIHRTEDIVVAHNDDIDSLISLIASQPDTNVVVAEQAAKIGISQKQLEQAFKNKQGVNVLTYVRLQRLDKAKQLLRESTLSVADISLTVGYADQSYFTRIFKRETGRTPSEFRDNVLGQIRKPSGKNTFKSP